jgi:hypothetical protein
MSKKGEREVFIKAINYLLEEKPTGSDELPSWKREVEELIREYLLAGGKLSTLQERFPSIELSNQ